MQTNQLQPISLELAISALRSSFCVNQLLAIKLLYSFFELNQSPSFLKSILNFSLNKDVTCSDKIIIIVCKTFFNSEFVQQHIECMLKATNGM